MLSPDQLKQVYEAAAAGRQIEAVRIYQAATGASLTEAMAYVEELAGQVTAKRPVIGTDIMPEARAGRIPHVPPPPAEPVRIVPGVPPSPLEEALGFRIEAGTPHAPHFRGMSPQDSAAFVRAVRNNETEAALQMLQQSAGLNPREAQILLKAMRRQLDSEPTASPLMPLFAGKGMAAPNSASLSVLIALIIGVLMVVILVKGYF